MRRIIFALAGIFIFAGCASVNSVPVPQDRKVASNEDQYMDLTFNRYFANQNYFVRLSRIEMLGQQLVSSMPDKGHAKKALVQQFLQDVHHAVEILGADQAGAASKYSSWIPSAQENGFNEKIHVLGKVLQSSKVMDRMGIYLTASGVFDEDSYGQNFYFDLINRALYGIDTELRNLTLVYRPEISDADENLAKLTYSKSLANLIRNNLRQVAAANSVGYKKLDGVLLKLAGLQKLSPAQAKTLLGSADYKYAQSYFSQVLVTSSGDISGFDDQVDLTLNTKFNFEMIDQLVSTVR